MTKARIYENSPNLSSLQIPRWLEKVPNNNWCIVELLQISLLCHL